MPAFRPVRPAALRCAGSSFHPSVRLDRREFLSALSVAGVTALGPAGRRSGPAWQAITARPTIFHAHPGGSTTLVRFVARGFEVPAGRLRAYGTPRRELLGTAGMLRLGDVLYGELWLPLERRRDVTTELEVPGRRGIIRQRHTLEPQPRWTMYWLTIAEPEALREELNALEPWRRGVRAALYNSAGVRGNPFSDRRDSASADHLTTLRLAVPAKELEAELGILVSPLAVTSSLEMLDQPAITALAGSGVRVLGLLEASDHPIQRLEIPGIPPLPVISAPAIRDPASLGFGASEQETVERIERWLTTATAFADAGFAAAVLVVGDEPASAPSFLAAARSWNSRFAFPRIVFGAAADSFLRGGAARTTTPLLREPTHDTGRPAPRADLVAMQRERSRIGRARAESLFGPLIGMLGGAGGDLQALVRGVAPRFPGTLVLNSSPFTRTDIVRFADGGEAIVTDVPGLGYALVIASTAAGSSEGAARWEPVPPSETIVGRDVRLTVNAHSGAIERVTDANGRSWTRAGAEGLNAVGDAELDSLTREIHADLGTRLTAHRRSRSGVTIRTTYTVYDALPWVDVENRASAGASAIEYRFAFPFRDAAVSWERPAGSARRTAPVAEFVHLRWLRLEGERGAVLFRGFHTPVAAVDRDGTLINMAPPGLTRFRLLFDGDRSISPWRFGWETEPLLAEPATPGGTGLLPSVGALLMIDQDDVSVLGVKPADDGDGAIVFLQDVAGESRLISLQPGLVRFQDARRVDFVERDLGSVDGTLAQGILVRLAPHETLAIRLRGLWLAGG